MREQPTSVSILHNQLSGSLLERMIWVVAWQNMFTDIWGQGISYFSSLVRAVNVRHDTPVTNHNYSKYSDIDCVKISS